MGWRSYQGWHRGWLCALAMLAAPALMTAPAPALADVAKAEPGSFEIAYDIHVAVPAAEAYEAVTRPGRWWNSEHSYSGDAANLTLDAKAGGCWCEALKDGGSVQHMRVIFADPGHLLRLSGGLGPLQELPLAGVMTWSFKDDPAGGSAIVFRYAVAGPLDPKMGWPPIVNAVLGEQVGRLKRYLDTGSPEEKK